MSIRRTMVGLLLVLAARDAGAQRARRCTGEVPRIAIDSAAPILRDCEVTKAARIDGARPDFKIDEADLVGVKEACYVAEIDIVIDTTGAVEPRLMTVGRSDLRALENAALARLPQVPFRPAELDGRRVRQLLRYRAVFEHTTFVVLGNGPGLTVRTRGKDCR